MGEISAKTLDSWITRFDALPATGGLEPV